MLKSRSRNTDRKESSQATQMEKQPNAPLDWGQLLKSGNRIFIGSNAAVPNALIDDLIANSNQLHDIEVVHIQTISDV